MCEPPSTTRVLDSRTRARLDSPPHRLVSEATLFGTSQGDVSYTIYYTIWRLDSSRLSTLYCLMPDSAGIGGGGRSGGQAQSVCCLRQHGSGLRSAGAAEV